MIVHISHCSADAPDSHNAVGRKEDENPPWNSINKSQPKPLDRDSEWKIPTRMNRLTSPEVTLLNLPHKDEFSIFNKIRHLTTIRTVFFKCLFS